MARNAKIETLFGKMHKEYGEKSVMWAKDIPAYDTISSGSLTLDYAIGIGGFPTSRVVEVAGAEGVGKTTLVLHTVDNALKKFPKKYALYVDIENRLTPDWVESFVTHTDRILVVKPDTMEQAADLYSDAVKSEQFCIAVVDSIGGAPSQRSVNKSAEVADFGGNSLAVGRFSRIAQTLAGKYDVLTIGINQVRDDMEGYRRFMTPGGRAWKHAVSLRVELKKGKDKVHETVDDDKVQVGGTIVAKIHKNSLSAPGKQATYWFYNIPSHYGFGVDQAFELASLSITTGIVHQAKQGTFEHESFPKGKIRGRDNVKSFIMEDVDAFEKIKQEVMDYLKTEHVSGITESFDVEPDESSDEKIDAKDSGLFTKVGA